MSPRFAAYLSILATRDAALISLLALAILLLVGWLGVRVAFSPRTQERLMLIGAIAYHLSLLVVVLIGVKS